MSTRLKPRKEDGKYIVQVLLPSAQGEYYVKHVEEELGRQVSAFTKDLVLNFVKGVCPKEQHDKLTKKDKAEWREVVNRRVETRQKEAEKMNKSKLEDKSNPDDEKSS
mgnify:CR=1 FL=1|tara:strand:+ start:2979 stop:3302 length:324 start_codon:yes stop_codon:yes gene_type:complete